MNEFDHLLAASLSLMSLSLLFRKESGRAAVSRLNFYMAAALTSIVFGGLTLFMWRSSGRAIGTFGWLGWCGNPAGTALAGLLWIIGLVSLTIMIRRGFLRKSLLGIFERYAQFLPRTAGEMAASWGVSAAVGVGEEIVYRGFLLWYGSTLLGWPAGLLLSTLLFGIAHGYQSRFGIVFATLAGLMLGIVYLASGSLLLVMWIHMTYDMASFATGRMVLRKGGFEALSADSSCSTRCSAS